MSFSVSNGTYISTADQIANAIITSGKLATDVPLGGGTILRSAWEPDSVVQGTWAWGSVAVFFGGYCQNTSNAQNDEITYKCYLSAGTYKIAIVGTKTADNAIGTFYIDTTSVGTIDQYAAAPANDQYQEITGITVATTGLKTIKIKLATRNGAATGWMWRMSCLSVVRTA